MPRELTWEEREVRELWDMQRRAQRLLQPKLLPQLERRGLALEPKPRSKELLPYLRMSLEALNERVTSRVPSVSWAWIMHIALMNALLFERLGIEIPNRQVPEQDWEEALDNFWNEGIRVSSTVGERDLFRAYVDFMVARLMKLLEQPGREPTTLDEKARRLLPLDALLLDTRQQRFWSAANFLDTEDSEQVVKSLVPLLIGHPKKRDLQNERRLQNALASVLKRVPNSKLFPEVHAESEAARQKVQADPRLRAVWEGKMPASELTREENSLLVRALAGSRPDLPTGEEYVRQMRREWRGLIAR